MGLLSKLFGQAKSTQRKAPVVATGKKREGKEEILVDFSRLTAILLYATDLGELAEPAGGPVAFMAYLIEKYAPLLHKELVARIQAGSTEVAIRYFDTGSKLTDPYGLVQEYCRERGTPDFHLIAQCTTITMRGTRKFDICLAFVVAASGGETPVVIFQDYDGVQNSVLVPV